MNSIPSSSGGLLDLIERIGNKLPDPSTLFLLGTILVMIISAVAVQFDWSVQPRLPQPVMTTAEVDGDLVPVNQVDENGEMVMEWVDNGDPIRATSLLTRDGLFWAIKNIKDNFIGFAPLGVVLVGMLGIGIAERTGMIGAMLKTFMLVVPGALLTPAMVFIGIMSSMALDAGYVILPPLAAALYQAVGRSPLAGLAAVFAGVAAGFNANLFVTGLDPMLAELSAEGAKLVDPNYAVAATCNWYFMAASTVVMTLTGWLVTSFFVERRLQHKAVEDGGPAPVDHAALEAQRLDAEEGRALKISFGVMLLSVLTVVLLTAIPGAPLEGLGDRFPRWVECIVPIIFFCFVIPGIVYGVVIGSVKNDKDLARLFTETMAAMAPIIVLAFFAGQFIALFGHSNLGRMLAMAGGQALGQADMPWGLLIVAFILVTVVFNLFIGSMSAKYAMFAPIFVPMLMLVGISPELTQAAYRIGDSVSNIITPLNAYLIIILVFMQQFVPKAGMGTLISTMLPYTIVFTIVWTIMLLAWVALGIPLGPEAPLSFDVAGMG